MTTLNQVTSPGSNKDLPTQILQLPGFNLPVNWTPHTAHQKYVGKDGKNVWLSIEAQGSGENLFPTALNDACIERGKCALPILTLREISMLQIMNIITDKPGWAEKIFDAGIVEKWTQETMTTDGADVSKPMMDWVIEEVRCKTKLFKAMGAVSVYNGDVVKSDSAISDEIKQALQKAVAKLEDVPLAYKDFHPGSDGKVLDLVHPSLFPLIYGRSRICEDHHVTITDCIQLTGTGSVLAVPLDADLVLDRKDQQRHSWQRDDDATKPYSRNFQWLPCDVDVSAGEAKITSYINNLHPKKFPGLYTIIEKIITQVIPLWNLTLSPLTKTDEPIYRRIDFSSGLEFDPDPDYMDESEKPPREEDEDEDDYYERLEEWADDIRKAVQPEPEVFSPPPNTLFETEDDGTEKIVFPVDLVRDYAKNGLQIIVKLANIELTPEKSQYDGGSWHVEGQLNEHICATALYYYDNENITDSYLAFRQQSQTEEADEMNYPQGVHHWLTEIYGCAQDGPAVQEVGSILCKEDRLVTFPNILQHQVQPFKLEDPKKPGHRKILALFLVDPKIKIISTANVPPQQREWWSELVENVFSSSEVGLSKLSNELKDKVFEEVEDFPIGMDEAKEIRLKLMDERKGFVLNHGAAFERNIFSLCEH